MPLPLVECPHCKSRIRSDRLTKHLLRVHNTEGQFTSKPTTSKQQRTATKKTKRQLGLSAKKTKRQLGPSPNNSPVLDSFLNDSSMLDWDFD